MIEWDISGTEEARKLNAERLIREMASWSKEEEEEHCKQAIEFINNWYCAKAKEDLEKSVSGGEDEPLDVCLKRLRKERDSEKESRDASLEQVLENAGEHWREQALDIFRNLPSGSRMTGEDLRLLCQEQNVKPHHHNAWGAFIAGLVRAGHIVPTGKYQPMRSRGSHARETKVYAKA